MRLKYLTRLRVMKSMLGLIGRKVGRAFKTYNFKWLFSRFLIFRNMELTMYGSDGENLNNNNPFILVYQEMQPVAANQHCSKDSNGVFRK